MEKAESSAESPVEDKATHEKLLKYLEESKVLFG
jgi:hypothetical protein